MALKKSEIEDGEVRYYGKVKTVSEVSNLYSEEEIASITKLSIRDAKLKSSAGIGAFANLTELVPGNNELEEAVDLDQLEKLEWLDLSENSLERATGLIIAMRAKRQKALFRTRDPQHLLEKYPSLVGTW